MESKSQNYFSSTYEIRVKDHLAKYWLIHFSEWTIENLENGEVLLKASNIDQARLHGVLNKIRDLNLTLLSVEQIRGKD